MSGVKQVVSAQKKWMYIGIAAAIVVLLGIVIALMATDKTDEMQAAMEAQQAEQEMMAKKAEFEKLIHSDIAAATQQFEAIKNNTELGNDAEKTALLMGVYDAYERVEDVIKADTLFNLSTDEVEQKKQEVKAAVLDVCDKMRLQAEELRSIDGDLANEYLVGADSITKVINEK